MTDKILIDRETVEQLVVALVSAINCLNSPFNADLRLVLRDSETSIKAGRAALAGAKPAKPIAFGRLVDGDIADVICPETHEYYEGDYAAPLAASTSAKTLKELAAKGCGKCFYQDCDFPNCCKRKDTQ